MPNLPRSIDVWVCPACERAHSHQAGQTASICGCTGWDAAGVQRVRATYVLSAVSEEMVERAAYALAEPHLDEGYIEESFFDDARRALDAALSTKEVDR